MSDWTPDRVMVLAQCVTDGMTSGQVARKLGLTRSTVIGKVRRLKLEWYNAAGTRKDLPKPAKRPSKSRPFRPLPEPVFPAAPPKPVPPAPNSLPVDIMGLNNETCRWPLWETSDEPRLYCGALEADLSAGCPYCDFHRRGGA